MRQEVYVNEKVGMIDKEWEEQAKNAEKALLYWFWKGVKLGYADIEVEIRKKKDDKGYIEVRPTPAIRTAEEQAIFEKE